MRVELAPTVDFLSERLAKGGIKPSGYDLAYAVSEPISNPRLVPAIISTVIPLGFKFRIFSEREDRDIVLLGKPAAFCRYFSDYPPYTSEKTFAMSRNVVGLDALRIAAHETAHALTVDPEITASLIFTPDRLRIDKSKPRLQETDYYHEREVIADTTALIVTTTLLPEKTTVMTEKVLSYLTIWRNAEKNLYTLKDEICYASAVILNNVAVKLNTGVTYEVG